MKSIQEEEELTSIESQFEHVLKVVKWSIADLNKVIHLLKSRMSVEETYISALTKLLKHNQEAENSYYSSPLLEQFNFFGDYQTTLHQCTMHFKDSLIKTLESRKEFTSCIKTQIETLLKLKDCHEKRRKKIKVVLSDKNLNYVQFRTRDIVKLHKTYFNKCTEYEDSNQITKKTSMSDFIQQVKSQMTNSDTNTKMVKLKKEVADTDHDYRQGVRILEFFRKKQIDTSTHAMKHVESILLAKYDTIKSIMMTVCKQEETTLLNQAKLASESYDAIQHIDGRKDTDQYFIEYNKLNFINPQPIYYDNFYTGICKNILFGSNLNDYCYDHSCTVPLLVTKCIQYLESNGGLEKEGIYRISGRQANLDALKLEFEKDEDTVDLSSKDVITVAAVLKTYLRELKQPLFNLCMQDRIEYSKITDDEKRKSILENRLSELSKPQRDTLEVVMGHLAKVESHEDVNKMNMNNLSVIFTPALFHDHNQAEHHGEWVADKVFEDLIHHHQVIFINAENIANIRIETSSIDSSNTLSIANNESIAVSAQLKSSLSRHLHVLKLSSPTL